MPAPLDPTVEVLVEEKEGRGEMPNITVRALRDGREIGSCIALSGGDYCHAREAQDCFFVDGLGITDREQGQGRGR